MMQAYRIKSKGRKKKVHRSQQTEMKLLQVPEISTNLSMTCTYRFSCIAANVYNITKTNIGHIGGGTCTVVNSSLHGLDLLRSTMWKSSNQLCQGLPSKCHYSGNRWVAFRASSILRIPCHQRILVTSRCARHKVLWPHSRTPSLPMSYSQLGWR